jgi:hypothetical protein
MTDLEIIALLIAGVFLYIFIGIITWTVCDTVNKGYDTNDENVGMSVFWPFTLVCVLLYFSIKTPATLFSKIIKGFIKVLRRMGRRTMVREVK